MHEMRALLDVRLMMLPGGNSSKSGFTTMQKLVMLRTECAKLAEKVASVKALFSLRQSANNVANSRHPDVIRELNADLDEIFIQLDEIPSTKATKDQRQKLLEDAKALAKEVDRLGLLFLHA